MASNWLELILLGGLLGMVGQGIRVIVGMKKLFDESQQKGIGMKSLFSGGTLAFSLLIGFVAGALGVLSLSGAATTEFSRETLVTLLGIGYAGADFIEGFVRKHLPGDRSAAAPAPAAAPAAPDDGQIPAVG